MRKQEEFNRAFHLQQHAPHTRTCLEEEERAVGQNSGQQPDVDDRVVFASDHGALTGTHPTCRDENEKNRDI